jgi:hypothetical protein
VNQKKMKKTGATEIFIELKDKNHYPDPFGPGLGKPDALSFMIETANRSH